LVERFAKETDTYRDPRADRPSPRQNRLSRHRPANLRDGGKAVRPQINSKRYSNRKSETNPSFKSQTSSRGISNFPIDFRFFVSNFELRISDLIVRLPELHRCQ